MECREWKTENHDDERWRWAGYEWVMKRMSRMEDHLKKNGKMMMLKIAKWCWWIRKWKWLMGQWFIRWNVEDEDGKTWWRRQDESEWNDDERKWKNVEKKWKWTKWIWNNQLRYQSLKYSFSLSFWRLKEFICRMDTVLNYICVLLWNAIKVIKMLLPMHHLFSFRMRVALHMHYWHSSFHQGRYWLKTNNHNPDQK
jgi:hypothetical protein